MNRREFMGAVGGMAIAMPQMAIAQTAKVYRLGTLIPGPPISPTVGRGAILIDELGKRGYKLGQNLVYEARGARSPWCRS